MRLSSAYISSLFNFPSARQQAENLITVTMAHGAQEKGKTPRIETHSASSQPLPPPPPDTTVPIPPSTKPISQACTDAGSQSSALVDSESFELHTLEPCASVASETFELQTLESSASAGPENTKMDCLDSQDAQGLAISSFPDAEKSSAQARDDQNFSAKSKKRNKRNAKKANAQGQCSQAATTAAAIADSPDILPLDLCGPTPALPLTLPKPNVGSPSVSPPLADTKPIMAEEICA